MTPEGRSWTPSDDEERALRFGYDRGWADACAAVKAELVQRADLASTQMARWAFDHAARVADDVAASRTATDAASRNVVTEVSPGRFHVRQASDGSWQDYEVKPTDDDARSQSCD